MTGHLGTIALVVLIALVIAGSITWAIIARKRKRERFVAFARERGWQARLDDKHFHKRNFSEFDLFNIGDSRSSAYIVTGEHDGRDFVVFRYTYSTGSGKNRSTHVQRVVALRTPYPAPPRPGLRWQREHWGHKVFDALGGSDIDFASDDFSRKYWVKCRDERFAFAVIHPRMMQHMLDRPTRLQWQWIGDRVVAYESGGLKVHQIGPLLDEATAWIQHLPRREVALSR